MRPHGSTLPLLLLLAGCSTSAAPADSGVMPGAGTDLRAAAATITPEDMRARIGFLASDALRGRDTPSPGLEAAAAYIASEFIRLGLQPAGEGGTYYQRYPMPLVGLWSGDARLQIGAAAGGRPLAYGTDYLVYGGTPNAVDGPLVWVGSEVPQDASTTGALRDRLVVAYVPETSFARPMQTRFFQVRTAARSAGARGVLFVLDDAVGDSAMAAMRSTFERPRRVVGAVTDQPAAFVRFATAREAFRRAGVDLDPLRQVRSVRPLGTLTASLEAPVRVIESASAPNVAAILPGSDPTLRDTYVVFSAHMDHVGVGPPVNGDSIYNGADDDASGTSAVIEMAEAFAALPTPPARSVMFLLVSGEEKGLWGSRYFSDNPTVPIEKIVANVNMDMIARNAPDSVVVIGQEYSSLGPLVLRVAQAHPDIGLTVSRDLWPEERFFFRSDHLNFARKEIPSLFFFSGVHEDYHRPSDEVEKIDAGKGARVARLAFYTAYEIAAAAQAPRWTEEGLAEVRRLTR